MVILQVFFVAFVGGALAAMAWMVGEVIRAAGRVGLGGDVAWAVTVAGVVGLLVGWLVL